MSEEQDCGRDRTCGGYFTSGPGDSEWRDCARHAADRGRFFEIYLAELEQVAGRFMAPAGAKERAS